MKASKYLNVMGMVSMVVLLNACQTTGDAYRADVYSSSQVNTQKEVKTVKLIAVMPARVEVDNSEAVKNAQLGGAIIGSILGGVVGANQREATSGAVLGGVVGAAAGSMADKKVLVDGVSLTYSYNGKTYNSVQVGKKCEYNPGTAVMIYNESDETRIQPNATCPKKG